MMRQRLVVLVLPASLLVAGVLGPATSTAAEGHGGGGGHALGGFRGGYYGGRYGYGRGFYGYPGWCGVGVGVGLGYGLGYGYGYPYGYPYYPYGYGYPVYVDTNGGPPPGAYPPGPPLVGQGPRSRSPRSGAAGPVRLTDSDVLLSIHVPPEAVVRINGVQTAQHGPRREFLSSGLSPGRSYTFDVKAEWMGPNGKVVQLERRIPVQGGERRAIDFLTAPPPNQEVVPTAGGR